MKSSSRNPRLVESTTLNIDLLVTALREQLRAELDNDLEQLRNDRILFWASALALLLMALVGLVARLAG